MNSYGYLLLSGGIGGMCGAIALAQFVKLRDSASIQTLTGVGLGISLIVFATSNSLQIAMIAIAIVGVFSVSFSTINNTFLQSIVDDKYRGRVSSIQQLGWGASAFGGLLLGSLAQAFGAPFALTLSAAIATLSIFSLCIYIYRSFNSGKNTKST